jgi:hypothetical protein
MAVKILFDKVEKNIFKNKLYIKYNDKVQTKNDNEEILKPKNLPKKNIEDVIDYLLINIKETLMNEMK